MIRAVSSLLALMLAGPSSAQSMQVSEFVSPCPSVFTYEPLTGEENKWYGIVNLTTDTTLYALWLDIVLDSKANILGNWIGEVTTDDNIDFKIENTKLTISPDEPLGVRFFIQYKANDTIPKLQFIRFNGREICQIETPKVVEIIDPVKAISYEAVRPDVTTRTTDRPTSTTRNYNKQQTTSQYWYQTEKPQTTANALFWTQTTPAPTTTTTLKPQYWTERTTESPRTTQKTQYWQQTTATLKPIYWTQAVTEAKSQTTVRTPVWPYVKGETDQQGTTTEKPTTQVWSQTRTESTPRTTTEHNAVVQNWSYSQTTNRNTTDNSQAQTQGQNNQQTSSVNRYQITKEIKEQTTVNPLVSANVKVAVNQSASFKDTTPIDAQIIVKQVGKTKYWSKIPAENITGAATWSGDQGLQNQPYAKVSIKPVQSTQNADQPKDTPLYIRPEVTQIISGNTYDANSNVENIPQSYSGVGSQNQQPARPVDSYQQTEQRQPNTAVYRPVTIPVESNVQTWPGQKTSSWAGDGYQTYVQSGSSGSTANDGGIKTLDGSSISYDKYQITTKPPAPAPNKIEEYDSAKPEDYYYGGLPLFYIPNHGPQAAVEPKCGKVLLNKGINLHDSSTLEGQWPWQIALYQQQTSVDFRYICGGTLVSKRHVITAAHCVTRKSSTRLVNKNTLTVYLGKHNLRNSVDGVQIKFVNKIVVYPEFDAMTFKSNLAILELRDSVSFSDRIQPVCLWPEHETALENVVGKTGSIVGWGYESTGVAKEELTQRLMAVVDQETCISSYVDFFRRFTSDKTYCAGYRDRESVCNGDSGGGMVFQKGDSWYLRGVVSLSVATQGTAYSCDPKHYVIFTDVAKFLPWIEDNIED